MLSDYHSRILSLFSWCTPANFGIEVRTIKVNRWRSQEYREASTGNKARASRDKSSTHLDDGNAPVLTRADYDTPRRSKEATNRFRSNRCKKYARSCSGPLSLGEHWQSAWARIVFC